MAPHPPPSQTFWSIALAGPVSDGHTGRYEGPERPWRAGAVAVVAVLRCCAAAPATGGPFGLMPPSSSLSLGQRVRRRKTSPLRQDASLERRPLGSSGWHRDGTPASRQKPSS